MARFGMELPIELMNEFQQLSINSEEMFGKMTRAGAKKVQSIVRTKVPLSEMVNHVKLSSTYKTPSDDGINTQVYISGYLPFSNPTRKYFARRNKKDGKMYYTDKGVPASFIAIMYEYGRSTSDFPRKPFFRKSFKENEIVNAMLEVQDEYLPKE